MTAVKAGASSTYQPWNNISVDNMTRQVTRLQMRIAEAVKEGKYGKVKSLQWLLTHSFAAKFLAVKRVTENKGKKTPGIDGASALQWQNTTLFFVLMCRLDAKVFSI